MSSTKTYKWFKIAESINDFEWKQNNMCVVEAGGKKISLAKFKEQIFAFANKCPHACGTMTDGCLDALGHAVCPIHRYKFELERGRNVSGEGYYLKIYPVECRPDGIFVGFEEKGFFNWL